MVDCLKELTSRKWSLVEFCVKEKGVRGKQEMHENKKVGLLESDSNSQEVILTRAFL